MRYLALLCIVLSALSGEEELRLTVKYYGHRVEWKKSIYTLTMHSGRVEINRYRESEGLRPDQTAHVVVDAPRGRALFFTAFIDAADPGKLGRYLYIKDKIPQMIDGPTVSVRLEVLSPSAVTVGHTFVSSGDGPPDQLREIEDFLMRGSP